MNKMLDFQRHDTSHYMRLVVLDPELGLLRRRLRVLRLEVSSSDVESELNDDKILLYDF